MHNNNKKSKTKNKGLNKAKRNCLDNMDQIAAELDLICRNRLRNGAIPDGVLFGMEPAIRQQALIKAMGGFLQNCPDYIAAGKSGDKMALQEAMKKCVAIAMKYAKANIAEELNARPYHYAELNECNGGSCQHPSQMSPTTWPADVMAKMVMTAVSRAVREGKLSHANAGIVDMVCVQGLRVREIARILRVSPPAISQHLRQVKKVIPDVIAQVEVLWVF